MGGQYRRALCAVVLALAVWLLGPRALLAQTEGAQSYTVAPGDTLFEIAQQFGISLDDLVAFNGITDPNLLEVGQLLLIPGPNLAEVPAPTPDLAVVRAGIGDTVAGLAAEYGESPEALSALNNIAPTARLFPGQPLLLPRTAVAAAPLRFGAIQAAAIPAQVTQGKTESVVIESNRPLALSGSWNGLPITFLPWPDNPQRQFAYLPAPALIAPGAYWLTVAYTATNGLLLNRSWAVPINAGAFETQDIILPPEANNTLDPAVVQPEEEKIAAIWQPRSPQLLWESVFARPVTLEYTTTSPFGTRRSYNSGPVNSYHAGQDFGAPTGVTVTAPGDGIVVLAEPLAVRGNAVILDHGAGVYTGYWHFSELKVAVGDRVRTGDIIGLVGTTGRSTGAHLHWEMRIYGVAVDPMQFLSMPLLAPQLSP
jgi:murein DD-endopeptidase MepM/ murein hydrolase activator NlpD